MTDAELLAVTREPDVTWVIPSHDEWYKAAYYKAGGIDSGYWEYATQSNTAPTAELPPGTDMVNGSANYYTDGLVDPTYYTTEVGAYGAKPSDSAYGTFDQGGNLWEWNEANFLGDGSYRGLRGGSFRDIDGSPDAGIRSGAPPWYALTDVGFRVAAIPEPATLALLALSGAAVLRRRRR